jgi:hypothetical protein
VDGDFGSPYIRGSYMCCNEMGCILPLIANMKGDPFPLTPKHLTLWKSACSNPNDALPENTSGSKITS